MSDFHSTKSLVWNFGNSTFPMERKRELYRPDPSHCAFAYCSCKGDTKERYWGQQFCQVERDILVRPTEITGPVKVDHLEIWVPIFQSDQTEMIRSIWRFNWNFRNFGLNEKCPKSLAPWGQIRKIKNIYAKALVEGQKWTTIVVVLTGTKIGGSYVQCVFRIVAPRNLALTTGSATWDILRRNTFVFVRLATTEKTVKN